jgi:hypothetical protein
MLHGIHSEDLDFIETDAKHLAQMFLFNTIFP